MIPRQKPSSRLFRDLPWAVIMLVAIGLFPAMSIWENNIAGNPSVGKMVAIGLALAVLGSLIASGLAWVFRVSLLTTATVVATLLVFSLMWVGFVNGLGSRTTTGEVSPVLLLVIVAYIVGVTARFGVSREAFFVLLSVAVAVTSVTFAQAVIAIASIDSPRLSVETVVASEVDGELPDVYFIVLDGYGRNDVLRDSFDFDNGRFSGFLEDRGFTIPSNAFSNYPQTSASLASALLLDYPLKAGEMLGREQQAWLNRILQGENPTIATLKAAGYQYFHVESGWGGTRCGQQVDRCFESPFLDESVWALLQRSVAAKPAKRAFGNVFPYNALDRLEMLPEVVDEVERSEGPVFVFAHILAPHPPAYLTKECHLEFGFDIDNLNVSALATNSVNELLERDRSDYVEQLQCVNRKMVEFVDRMGVGDAVVAIVADHGSASSGQLMKPPDSWTEAQILERLATFSAIRLPRSCPENPPDDLVIVNVLRVVLRCTVRADLPDLAKRFFVLNQLFPNSVSIEIDQPS